mgnify:CR=1 FL=1
MTAERVLVLRVCRADLTSPSIDANGFRWPEAGEVAAPDWSPAAGCGRGLHGWLWGEGRLAGNVPDNVLRDPGARWLVVEVVRAEIVELPGKVKFPRGEVIFVGDREAAVAYLVERAPSGKSIAFHRATAGYGGTATAGEGGTIAIRWWDEKRGKYRLATAEVGEHGIEPATAYCLEIVDGAPQWRKRGDQ